MPVPTQADHQLDDLENLHGAVMIKLRTWQHAGRRRDPEAVRRLLQAYVDGAVDYINGVE
ncbi:hypothetical protein [Bradyrhizobium symbiodeficiens]|uniref:hypothetical protein n=1 Tax=Bradyrhizobium symbiodeficiens TaxID=1404367 RepID=UPI000BA1B8C2|nr:hypothetical protein [Bradyrhizobium symbiodeficiens]AWM07624.1 hypothetical protein CIT39_15000 [Bradyrhizobium symbiodeficiens]